MRLLPEGWRRAFRIWPRAVERDVDAELAFHLDERIADLIAGGATAEQARSRANAEFGDVAAARERLVEIDAQLATRRSQAERFEWIWQDLRYVARSLRRSPGFVITVALTLALGLGANAAIFSLLDRLFLRAPAGIVRPDRVHRVYRLDPAGVNRRVGAGDLPANAIDVSSVFSHDDFVRVRETAPSGVRLAGYSTSSRKLGRGDDAVRVNLQFVLADFFGALGVAPIHGRLFQDGEQRIETPTPVVVVSDALWRTRFAARPDIVGLTVDLDYHQYTVIGVASPDFRGPDNDAADAWVPMNMMGTRRGGATWYSGGHGAWIRTLGVTDDARTTLALEQAATAAFRQSAFRPDSLATARVAPLIEASIAGFDEKEVTIATRLAGVAIIVLLIGCANVANLLLARGMQRRREIALRLALGVTRRRLVALLLSESLVVSLIGAAVAVVVALWGAAALREQLLPRVHWIGAPVDLRVLAFTVALAIGTGVLAGLGPAIRSSRPDLTDTLKGSARDGVVQRSRARTMLLVAQSALSVVLLAGAGVFIRSLHSVETENIGYDTDRIVYAQVAVDPDHAERSAEIAQRLPALADEIRRMPGVERSALTAMTPMEGFSWLSVYLPGRDSLPHVAVEGPFTSYVSADFFATVGMHVTSGRGLSSTDRFGDGAAVVVNETMARSFWPGRSAVGECMMLRSRDSKCIPIVGVVSDAHFDGIIEKPSMQFYLPLPDSGNGWRASVVAIRAGPGRAGQVAARVRQLMNGAFSGWAESDVSAMSDHLARELHSWRTGAELFTAAGLLALLVAIVGVYSTISYSFSQRTHEIGVRVALGARAADVIRLVIGAGIRIVLAGVVIGIALSLAAGRLVESLLYKTSPRDPAVLIVVSGSLLLVAVAACLVPAWRALRVDPAIALRAD